MADCRSGSVFVRCALVVGLLSSTTGVASAHGVSGSRFDAPLPLPLLFLGAGATVAVTALWMVVRQQSTRVTHRRHIATIPSSLIGPIRYSLQVIFLTGFVIALFVGALGQQIPAENFATVFTWLVWFRGVALIAILFGNPWRILSPWWTIYRGLVSLEGRRLAVLGSYPSFFEEWPAVVGIVVLLGVVENLTVIPRSPRLTTVILAVYTLLMIGGAVLYGVAWFHRADPLGVIYRLFGRVSMIHIVNTDDSRYTVTLRSPWQGCLDPVRSLPLVVVIITMIYTVSFDGFTNTRLYQILLFGVDGTLETGSMTSILLYFFGLGWFITVFWVGSWIVEWVGAGERDDWQSVVGWFAPTLLPIAAAYEIAHNYPYVIRNVGQLIVISTRLINLNVPSINPLEWLSLPLFWGSQVILIVGGHIVAVIAAHYAAVERYETRRVARRSHLPLVVLMVGYTMLSLWIISQPVVTG